MANNDQQKKERPKLTAMESKLLPILERLNKYAENAYRTIDEYDINDESDDVILWSREKTVKEIEVLLKQLFADRTALRNTANLNELAYQDNVRGWYFNLPRDKNGYIVALKVLENLADRFSELHPLLKTETDEALKRKYYKEALVGFNMFFQYDRNTLDDKIEKLEKYTPLFADSPECTYMEANLLVHQANRDLGDWEKQRQMSDTEWKRLDDLYEGKINALKAKFVDNPYKVELNNMANSMPIVDLFNPSAQITEYESGEVKVEVSGVQRRTAELWRSSEPKNESEEPVKEKLKTYTFKGKERINDTFIDHLGTPGNYYYYLVYPNSKVSNDRLYTCLEYSKIIASYNKLGKDVSICVISLTDGKPEPGVTVTLSERAEEGKHLATATTDKNGIVSFDLSKYPNYRSFATDVKDPRYANGSERLFLWYNGDRKNTINPHNEVHFYLDRPLYKRGQKILAGIALTYVDNEGSHPRGGVSGELRLYSYSNDKKVLLDTKKYNTNANGVAELSFDIPKDESLNNFFLQTEDTSHQVIVQDYKLNYLTVTIDSIPTGAVIGKPMTVKGRTTDLNGNPVPAKIELTYRNKKINGESTKDGSFDMTIDTIPSRTYAYWGTYSSLLIKATDALGNVAQESVGLEVNDSTNMPLDASAMIGKEEINKEKFSVSTEEQRYQKSPMGDLSRYHLMGELVRLSTNKSTMLGELPINGKKEFSLPSLESGMYKFVATVVDYFGKTISSTMTNLYVYSPSDTRLVDDKEFLADYVDGESSIIYGSNSDVYIHFIAHSGSKKLPTHEIKKVEAGKLYRMDVIDKEVSNIDVYTRDQGKSKLAYLRIDLPAATVEDTGLSIEGMDMIKDKPYLPGAQFTRELTVKDKNGSPLKEAPVFVTVFDKAVAIASKSMGFWQSLSVENPQSDEMLIADSQYGMVNYGYGSRALKPKWESAEQSFDTDPEFQIFESLVSSDLPRKRLAGASSNSAPAIAVRSNFVETAYFSVLLKTDEKGKVKLDFKLPDTQTKYLTKVYTFTPDTKLDLQQDYEFEVFSPVSVEISLPRYLHMGDKLLGEIRLMNTLDTAEEISYTLKSDDRELQSGTVTVDAKSTSTVPFSLPVGTNVGSEMKLTASAISANASDVVERKLPILSDQYSYTVATPISAYKEEAVNIEPAKPDRMQGMPLLDLYFSPANIVLSGLANEFAVRREVSKMSLFEAVHQLATYAEIQEFLSANATVRADLQNAVMELKAAGADEVQGGKSVRSDRVANAGALVKFYEFILNGEKLSKYIDDLQQQILKSEHPGGGFTYSMRAQHPSPWITSYVLDAIRGAAQHVASPKMKQAIDRSFEMILKEMKEERWFRYTEYMRYRLLLHEYGKSDKAFLAAFQKDLDKQVESARSSYQKTTNSSLIIFARYSRTFDDKEKYVAVEQFIRDRSEYSMSDRELLLLQLFLNEDNQTPVSREVIAFMLKLKQGTIWEDPFTLDAVKVLLRQVAPTKYGANASIKVGEEMHELSPIEKAIGHTTFPLRELKPQMSIVWNDIQSEYVFGGLRYHVSEPMSQVTPTGEQLKVLKEVYARRIVDGKSQLIRLSDEKPAQQGEQLVVRYLVETAQDLSLITIKDERSAGAEPGYDFMGYGVSDRVWWSYTRRETADYLFIDYLPRGKHVFEIEATATLGGHFAYGPAQVQSYYAPEYAGNSAGGTIHVDPNNPATK